MKTKQEDPECVPSALRAVVTITVVGLWAVLYPYSVLPFIFWVTEKAIESGTWTQSEAFIVALASALAWYMPLYMYLDITTRKYVR
jgi:hypothetical protein